MKMNKLMTGAFALTVATSATLPAFADGETPPPPVVSGVTMTQAFDRKVTINYTLADGPAVITLDVQTNATPNAAADDPGWTSIGGEAIWNAAGDVWKKIEGDTTHTITWRPDQSWPGHKITGNGARAVVTAWATNNTPDYMVVHLDVPGATTFYPAAEFLPKASFKQEGAAVTNNPAYKTTKLLMRKIEAAGIEWTMGSTSVETQRTAANETPHLVTLANNYYIGVFQVTQAQYARVMNGGTAAYFNKEGSMRPMENVSWSEIRTTVNTTTATTVSPNTSYYWPAAPYSGSFLGRLRTNSGLDFDLPSDAEWEFAARSGNYDGFWGDGSPIRNATPDGNLNALGRYRSNNPGGTGTTATFTPTQGGTDIVGSYNPSSWGLYDMHGNVWEWCLDWFEANVATYGGKVNVDLEAPTKTLSGAEMGSGDAARHVIRGGYWGSTADQCRSANRSWCRGWGRSNGVGFRVACPVGIQ